MKDVENNTPLREAMKTRFRESRGNLKRKAEEKINSLMRGSGYKVSVKTPGFSFLSATSTLALRLKYCCFLNADQPKENHRKVMCGGRVKTKSKKKKKIQVVGRKTKKPSKRCRAKKCSLSDIFS